MDVDPLKWVEYQIKNGFARLQSIAPINIRNDDKT